MNVICLEEDAFNQLVDKVIERVTGKAQTEGSWKWISDEKAMELLNIKSKTTLQKLRDEGSIRFSHPQKRIILYDRDSIHEYLEKHAKDTF